MIQPEFHEVEPARVPCDVLGVQVGTRCPCGERLVWAIPYAGGAECKCGRAYRVNVVATFLMREKGLTIAELYAERSRLEVLIAQAEAGRVERP